MYIEIKNRLDEEEAIVVAEKLQKAGTLLRFYLGRLWNAVSDETKVVLCDKFGYQPTTMNNYKYIVNNYPANFEQDYIDNPKVTFSHFDYAARASDPVATFEEAVSAGMSSKDVRRIVAQNTQDRREELKSEEEPKEELPYEEPTSEFEYQENVKVTKGRSEEEVRITPKDIFKYFGCMPTRMTKEIYGLLYRNASKSWHPDITGDNEEFIVFTRAAEYLSRYVTD